MDKNMDGSLYFQLLKTKLKPRIEELQRDVWDTYYGAEVSK